MSHDKSSVTHGITKAYRFLKNSTMATTCLLRCLASPWLHSAPRHKVLCDQKIKSLPSETDRVPCSSTMKSWHRSFTPISGALYSGPWGFSGLCTGHDVFACHPACTHHGYRASLWCGKSVRSWSMTWQDTVTYLLKGGLRQGQPLT